MPRRYPAEFRRKVLDLVAAGRPVAQIAHGLDISAQVVYTWRRQQLVGSGQLPGMTSGDHAEFVDEQRDDNSASSRRTTRSLSVAAGLAYHAYPVNLHSQSPSPASPLKRKYSAGRRDSAMR